MAQVPTGIALVGAERARVREERARGGTERARVGTEPARNLRLFPGLPGRNATGNCSSLQCS